MRFTPPHAFLSIGRVSSQGVLIRESSVRRQDAPKTDGVILKLPGEPMAQPAATCGTSSVETTLVEVADRRREKGMALESRLPETLVAAL